MLTFTANIDDIDDKQYVRLFQHVYDNTDAMFWLGSICIHDARGGDAEREFKIADMAKECAERYDQHDGWPRLPLTIARELERAATIIRSRVYEVHRPGGKKRRAT